MSFSHRFVRPVRALLLALSLTMGGALASDAYTLIVAPARYSVMQVAFDLLNRTPSVLVSYQGEGTTTEPMLHAWNGSEWVFLSLKDYREVNFLQRQPDLAVIIGDDALVPTSLIEATSWAPQVARVRDLTTSAIINEVGHLLNWKSSEWKWFSARYNLKLEDEAEPRRHSSWYDQAGPLPDRPHPLGRLTERKAGAAEPQPVPVVNDEPLVAAPAVEVMPEPEPAPVVEAAPAPVMGDADAQSPTK